MSKPTQKFCSCSSQICGSANHHANKQCWSMQFTPAYIITMVLHVVCLIVTPVSLWTGQYIYYDENFKQSPSIICLKILSSFIKKQRTSTDTFLLTNSNSYGPSACWLLSDLRFVAALTIMLAIIWFHNCPPSPSQFHQVLLRNKVLPQTNARCFLMKSVRMMIGIFVNSLHIVLTSSVNCETWITTQRLF